MELAEARGSEDDAQLAFDALLYRLLVIGEAVKALPADLRRSVEGGRAAARPVGASLLSR
jgi:hypothetical protein